MTSGEPELSPGLMLRLEQPGRSPVDVGLRAHVVTLGRSPACTIALEDPLLSRLHAALTHEGGAWYLEDRGSRNGTRLNGAPILSKVPIRAGDQIGIGRASVVLLPVPSSSSASVVTCADEATEGRATLGLVARSEAQRRLSEELDVIAPSSLPVLITGESGVGKEVVAAEIHRRSRRASGPFLILNCPALPAGLMDSELFGVERGVATGVEARSGRLEAADGGTLFLDEVGDLEVSAQAKLLRFLQDRVIERIGARRGRPIDVRIVAATNKDLARAVEAGTFRLDLLHRLKAVELRVLPLRERREDIPELARQFVVAAGARTVDLREDTVEELMRRDWPGNVRELEQVMARAVLNAAGGAIEPCHVPGAPATQRVEPGVVVRDRLASQLLSEGQSFWNVVRAPFLRRELPRHVVQDLMRGLLAESGGSYRELAGKLGMHGQREYKRFVNFLRNHELRPGSGTTIEPRDPDKKTSPTRSQGQA